MLMVYYVSCYSIVFIFLVVLSFLIFGKITKVFRFLSFSSIFGRISTLGIEKGIFFFLILRIITNSKLYTVCNY